MDEFNFELSENCSEEQWREFFQAACWKEFQDTIKARLTITRTELEACSADEFPRLQGEAKSMRFILAFSSLILAECESKRKEQEDELPE